jgi:hypothetical protein
MHTSILDLLPSISTLSYADKFRLIQLVLEQLAQENNIEIALHPVTRKKTLRGCLKNYAQPNLIAQEQDIWPAIVGGSDEHC